jgi:hypothetical protein
MLNSGNGATNLALPEPLFNYRRHLAVDAFRSKPKSRLRLLGAHSNGILTNATSVSRFDWG